MTHPGCSSAGPGQDFGVIWTLIKQDFTCIIMGLKPEHTGKSMSVVSFPRRERSVARLQKGMKADGCFAPRAPRTWTGCWAASGDSPARPEVI